MRARYIPQKNAPLPRPNRIDFGSGEKAAGKFLPRGNNREGAQIIPATTVGRNRYEGELGNPVELKPSPFEITIETPREAPPELQTKSATAALNIIMEEYRPFLASQQNI